MKYLNAEAVRHLIRISIPIVLLLGPLSLETDAASLITVGSPSTELSSADIAEIRRLSKAEGGEPWLFIGVGGPRGFHHIVRAFCSSEDGSDGVRRGVLVHVGRNAVKGNEGAWLPWAVLGSERWAQVSVTGREFDDIKDDKDNNRPFSVKGSLSDEALRRIVQFVRSSPTWIIPPLEPLLPERSIKVKGDLPIWWIHQKENNRVEVNLLEGRDRGYHVTLEERDDEWVIVSIGNWIS